MTIEIRQKDENTSWEELTDLFHEAFQERLDQGLHFTCSYFTPEELERQSANNIVLVAIDSSKNVLAGTVSIEIHQDDCKDAWADHYNLAVKPAYKKNGIASRLFSRFQQIVESRGCRYIKSDTAVGAESSVRWHLKNGFIPIRLRSFPSTNYYSIVFRKQLKKHWFWSNETFCCIHFALSSALCPLYRHEDGSLTVIGKLIDRLR